MAGKHAGAPEPDGFGEAPHPEPASDTPVTPALTVHRTGSRRVSTVPAAGSDPTPQATPEGTPVRAAEDTDEAWGARSAAPISAGPNDDRLKSDVPPHW